MAETKKKIRFFSALLAAVCLCTSMQAEERLRPHYVTVGPEIYSVKRQREGRTRQTGELYGVRGSYDYLARYKLYAGFEGAYAHGTLKGKLGNGEKIRSRFTDSMLEGRFGYTLQSRSGCCGWWTPFVGGGYFWEKNNYIKPSPKSVHFLNRYAYVAAGFLSGACIRPGFDVGLNVTARFSMDGKVHVSHDPDAESQNLKYEQKVNCRVVLPLSYIREKVNFSLAPFFEYRHYGRLNALPYDFLDTRLKIYGVDLFFILAF